MSILLAGGAGYIGSHTAVELINRGYDVIIADNLSNSYELVIDRIEKISGKRPKFYKVDTRSEDLERVFKENNIDLLVDFAAYKAVGDSVKNPIKYYDNNLFSLINTLKLMDKYDVKKIVFSSSATVYGVVEEKHLPVKEDYPRTSVNPYGSTKVMGEQILEDLYNADDSYSIAILRYFNPIGAHESGLIGEESTGIPANIMPYMTKVALGELPYLNVFGDDYDTKDGTGVRDYIHVLDLASGHVNAIEKLLEGGFGLQHINLGTGKGYSVYELIEAFSKASGIDIAYKVCPRRPGDAAVSYADSTKASKVLGWTAKYDIYDMCRDSWNWQKQNPNGYEG
ncbi:UDP-glucose 4-epimerase [Peptostreptococcus anaerobius]|uniref:UDP-glucose 4-epimerase n=1 Tax=Peptostreptococcus anaerobius TaxID=1261 RepID=A0A379CEX0_9FIRM|nr:UDP-glucose 4-epimerase GalE [Peptostreptococcus anaerobius]EKX95559.1 UDP-glucose 4-epimerase [Peptostreptococcus anaerobius VPI 4330 = DSM 2949]SFM78936.1 UDP-glucose 4-epimerase [Peptostreptococcus anaerobius]SUB60830.1 UDP-glucose 4-epimerase [Peptostreptococcus anaerobius]